MSKSGERGPRAGLDYPRDLVEFDEFFPTEENCRRYFERVRWRDGFVCRACGRSGEPWRIRRDVLLCRHCRAESRLTAGTILEGKRKPLRLWYRAMWQLTSQKYGANALGLQRVLGLGSYTTAWAWLHKLRRAMVRPGRDRLHGCVEVDESYVGGEEPGVRGRETIKKAIVAIAVEVEGNKSIGRVRLRHVPDVSGPSLQGFVTDVVDPGAIVHTDGWPSYAGLSTLGFEHHVTVISASPSPAHCPDASCASRGLAAQALAAWHAPGRSQRGTSAVLSRRVHFSFQPSSVARSWHAVLPTRGASRTNRSRHYEGVIQEHGAWSPPSPRWREVDTPFCSKSRGLRPLARVRPASASESVEIVNASEAVAETPLSASIRLEGNIVPSPPAGCC